MFYTKKLINFGLDSVVPFFDQISDTNQSSKLNTKEDKLRLKVAKSMERAIKKGQINPSYSTSVQKMKEKAIKNLNEASYQKQHYVLDQAGKVSSIVNILLPGSRTIVVNVVRFAHIQNIYEYAKQSSSSADIAMKAVKVSIPIISSVGNHLWMPILAPMMTVPVIATGVAIALGTTLVLDAIQ